MFKNLFSRDLPAAKAYHANKLTAAGNDEMAETVRSDGAFHPRVVISSAEIFAVGLWNLVKRTADEFQPVELSPFNSPLLRRE